jgi:uncharacterized protein YfaT (DUF1175 family)
MAGNPVARPVTPLRAMRIAGLVKFKENRWTPSKDPPILVALARAREQLLLTAT